MDYRLAAEIVKLAIYVAAGFFLALAWVNWRRRR